MIKVSVILYVFLVRGTYSVSRLINLPELVRALGKIFIIVPMEFLCEVLCTSEWLKLNRKGSFKSHHISVHYSMQEAETAVI